MFGKAKEQFELVKKAKELQKKMKETIVEGESGSVKITMNGELKVQSVTIEEGAKDLEKDIMAAFNNAVDKAQKVGQEIMKEMGGLGAFGM